MIKAKQFSRRRNLEGWTLFCRIFVEFRCGILTAELTCELSADTARLSRFPSFSLVDPSMFYDFSFLSGFSRLLAQLPLSKLLHLGHNLAEICYFSGAYIVRMIWPSKKSSFVLIFETNFFWFWSHLLSQTISGFA